MSKSNIISRGGTYYLNYQHNGRRYRESLGERNRRRAASKAAERIAEIKAEEPKREPQRRSRITLEYLQALDIIDTMNRLGKDADHVKKLKSKWNVILSNCDPSTLVNTINYDWLRTYEGRRREKGVRGQTIVREFQAIKRCVNMAVRRKLIVRPDILDDWPKIRRNPKDEKRSGKLRPPELIRAYLAELTQDARDEVEFALYTGLRWKELKRVKASWVEPYEAPGCCAVLRVPAIGKNVNVRGIPLSHAAFAIVKRRIEANPNGEYVFARAEFKKQRREASVTVGSETTITLRDMRHTFATVVNQGTDSRTTQTIMGHNDIATTNIYLSTTLDRAAAAVGSVAGYLGEGEEKNRVVD